MPSVPVKQLDRKHHEWKQYQHMWDRLDVLYEGGVRLQQNSESFLIKRPKELYDVFAERYRRLTYQDILGNCIGWYLAKLFQREPNIDMKTSDDRAAAFLQDCDRAGTTYIEFFAAVLECQMLFRRAFVAVSKPRAGLPVITCADEKAQGLDQPYLVLYDPRAAINWASDAYGNLSWIILRTVTMEQPDPLGDLTQFCHWWIYDRTTFRHYRYKNPANVDANSIAFFNQSGDAISDEKATADLIDEGKHELAAQNRVPIRSCELPMSLWFANRNYLHLLEHVDAMNGYCWQLFMANHPQLVIQTQRALSGVTKSEVSYIELDPMDKIFYLAPDVATFKESREHLNDTRQEVYRGFHLQAQGRPPSASADGSSGYSKELEMAPATDILNKIGDKLRAQMQNVALDYKAAAGMSIEGREQTPDVNGFTFEKQPAMGDIALAQAATDLGVTDKSPTLEKHQDKKIALALADGANEETKEAIIQEIESAPTRPEKKDAEQQAQQQAFEQRFQRATATGVLREEAGAAAAA